MILRSRACIHLQFENPSYTKNIDYTLFSKTQTVLEFESGKGIIELNKNVTHKFRDFLTTITAKLMIRFFTLTEERHKFDLP